MFQSFENAADRSFAGAHLPLLRAQLAAQDLSGFIVPHEDEYLNEYLPDYAERLAWVSGFTGSAGLAIVLADKAAVFSDGRYTLQLRDQVDEAYFSLHQMPESDPASWLEANVPVDARIGYDPLVMPETSLAPFSRAASRAGFMLVPTTPNLIDEAWADQPARPNTPLLVHPIEFAGRSSREKREEVGRTISQAGAKAALITAPASIAWLFNIRGSDVHATPLALSRAVVYADGAANLFVHPHKLSDEVAIHLGADVTSMHEQEIDSALRQLGENGDAVLVDPNTVPVYFTHLLRDSGAQLVRAPDPCLLPKAEKNEVELNGARAAHIRDGVAITRFLHWLDTHPAINNVTEIAAVKQLEAFRRETGVLRDVSFDTISGAGAHGAVVHYRVTNETDRPLKEGELFLVDSGGQYQDGTTDITRTVAVGTPAAEMRRHYTLVLKGHIALATARFPHGTTGHQLDVLARHPLWQAGLDYDHGTGHGVGSFLGVHEGPQNISKKPIYQPLRPGMICSNEPGYYVTGEYGIRIENLVIVRPTTPVDGGAREMMSFETITLAPLERELIDRDLLTEEERAWVDAYHASVVDKLSTAGTLSADVTSWLERRCAPL